MAIAKLTTTAAGHITVTNGQPTTTTQDIADVYGKQHAKVLAIVRQRMNEAGDWGVANFSETPHTNPQNGQTYTVIRMTEKGFSFVVGKFTGAKAVAHQIAYVEAFDRMRTELHHLADPSKMVSLPAPDTINAAQAYQIKAAVEAKCKGDPKAYSACYRALYDAFHVPGYRDLPTARFAAALEFVKSWESAKPKPDTLPPGMCLVSATNLAGLIQMAHLAHETIFDDGLYDALNKLRVSFFPARLYSVGQELQSFAATLSRQMPGHALR